MLPFLHYILFNKILKKKTKFHQTFISTNFCFLFIKLKLPAIKTEKNNSVFLFLSLY